jgi:bifunctional polynucleotide phosphatase/kinase
MTTENIVLSFQKFEEQEKKPILAFDYDGTLVKPREGRPFPKDIDDWQWIRESVPTLLREKAQSYRIVVVTDQTKSWKIEQIRQVMEQLDIPVLVLIGMTIHKPDTRFYNSILDSPPSMYIGDAGGRTTDWSDVDVQFAKALGVPFQVPEWMFPLPTARISSIDDVFPAVGHREVVIMVGCPASGKTTLALQLVELRGYYRVDGDKHKTPAAMVCDARKNATAEQSVVFDSTGGSRKRRDAFHLYAKGISVPVRLLWVQTPNHIAVERNKERDASHRVPPVAFGVYTKYFDTPAKDEVCYMLSMDKT